MNTQNFYVTVKVLIKKHNKFLALHTNQWSDGTPQSFWKLPGGKIDQGLETPADTLKRELQEEIGLSITSAEMRKLKFINFYLTKNYFKNGNRLLVLVYELNLLREFTVVLDSECDQFRWFALKNLQTVEEFKNITYK